MRAVIYLHRVEPHSSKTTWQPHSRPSLKVQTIVSPTHAAREKDTPSFATQSMSMRIGPRDAHREGFGGAFTAVVVGGAIVDVLGPGAL